jgi:thiamine-phosphate pyrophosphorylase
MTLDRFYPILDSAEWIARLVPLGVRTVQLRMKDRPEAELRDHIRASLSICRRHGCQLIVNDHWRLAIDEGCGFVHLGQEDLAAADRGAIRRAGLKLGVSTHDPAELDAALAAGPDYIALGPIWPTLLKKMKWAPQGVERLSEWRQRLGTLALVAIGGITPERLPAVFAHGASAAAVVTDIVRAADPEARTREWIAATAAISLPEGASS